MPVKPSFRRPLRRRVASFALVLAVGGALSGCSWFKGKYDDDKCPVVSIPDDLARVTHYQGQGTTFANVAVSAQLSDAQGTCTFQEDGITVDMTVSVLASLGPAATDRTGDFAYFVAILDPSDKIIAKKIFPSPIDFPPGQTRRGSVETISQHIPLSDAKLAGKYKIEVGFQLSQEELSYNRGGH